MVVVARDVTLRRQMEHEVQIQERLDSLTPLAGGIAHEFNNQLTVVLNHLELALARNADAPSIRADLTEARIAAEDAALISSRLLAFGQQRAVDPRPADVIALLKRIQGIVAGSLPHGVRLTVEVPSRLAPVRMNVVWLEQGVLSLVLNARDALAGDGMIVLRARAGGGDDDSMVCIEVIDDGPGMSDEVQARAFDPFFTTKAAGIGSGLGLSVVQGFVQQSGGRVEIESAIGRGTIARVLVPAVDGDPTEPHLRPRPADRSRARRVLLVEDDPAVRRGLRRILQDHGYDVAVAPDGEAGVAGWETRPCDLLVTDVRMPRMGGVDLATALRSRGFEGPILFVSGYAAADFAENPELSAPSSFLSRPFRAEALLATLEEMSEEIDLREPPRSTPGGASPTAPAGG